MQCTMISFKKHTMVAILPCRCSRPCQTCRGLPSRAFCQTQSCHAQLACRSSHWGRVRCLIRWPPPTTHHNSHGDGGKGLFVAVAGRQALQPTRRYWSWYHRGCWHQTCSPMDIQQSSAPTSPSSQLPAIAVYAAEHNRPALTPPLTLLSAYRSLQPDLQHGGLHPLLQPASLIQSPNSPPPLGPPPIQNPQSHPIPLLRCSVVVSITTQKLNLRGTPQIQDRKQFSQELTQLCIVGGAGFVNNKIKGLH